MSTDSTASPAPVSPFQYTVDLTKVLFAALVATLALGGFYVSKLPTAAPVVQPSVPSLIPPPFLPVCPGGGCRPSLRPFVVVCPHCRGSLTVRPSELGATTELSTGSTSKPASK